jgi:hypothetical protein
MTQNYDEKAIMALYLRKLEPIRSDIDICTTPEVGSIVAHGLRTTG